MKKDEEEILKDIELGKKLIEMGEGEMYYDSAK